MTYQKYRAKKTEVNGIVFDMDTSKNLERNILDFSPEKRVFHFPTWIPLGS